MEAQVLKAAGETLLSSIALIAGLVQYDTNRAAGTLLILAAMLLFGFACASSPHGAGEAAGSPAEA